MTEGFTHLSPLWPCAHLVEELREASKQKVLILPDATLLSKPPPQIATLSGFQFLRAIVSPAKTTVESTAKRNSVKYPEYPDMKPGKLLGKYLLYHSPGGQSCWES